MKPTRSCIFCGKKGGITKEHLWPTWLSNHIQKGENDRNIAFILAGEGKQPFELTKELERQGNVITKGFRVVCNSCNNGWMSKRESLVKPILLKFLSEEDWCLSQAEVECLAQWVATKVIVGEHAEPQMALTPAKDREILFKESRIPDYFRIYAGIHSSRSDTGYFRHSATLSTSTSGPEPPLSNETHRNIQTTAFLFGRLIVFVISVRIVDLTPEDLFQVKHMARLWPPSDQGARLNEYRVMSDADIQQLYQVLNRLIASPNVKYGGPLPR